MSKQENYSNLVADRKICRDCMAEGVCNKGSYKNQSEFKPEWDTDHLGNLSTWANDLDAEVLIIGQDYCDAKTYKRDKGRIQKIEIKDLENVKGWSTETNYHLRLLVKELGLDIGSPTNGSSNSGVFLTNAILCMKPGGMSDANPQQVYNNCGSKFLRPLIELVQPKAVITLGAEATRAVLFTYGKEHPEFKQLRALTFGEVLEKGAIALDGNTTLFPVCHPGNYGRMYRKKNDTSGRSGLELQKEDWRSIAKHLGNKASMQVDAKAPAASVLSQREMDFRYNMVKGRVAETLIQELFLSLGYNVFHYGMERSVPGISNLLKGIKSPVAREIRSMPDFIMQDRQHEVYFVEVKYRANGSFSFKDLPKDYPWENAFFIIVSKKHIKCLTYQELKRGKEISPRSGNYLSKRKEFQLDRDTIISFCEMAVKFFEGV